MLSIPTPILLKIGSYLDFASTLRLRHTCHKFMEKLQIKKLPTLLLNKITDESIKLFPKLEKINSPYIQNIPNHIKFFKKHHPEETHPLYLDTNKFNKLFNKKRKLYVDTNNPTNETHNIISILTDNNNIVITTSTTSFASGNSTANEANEANDKFTQIFNTHIIYDKNKQNSIEVVELNNLISLSTKIYEKYPVSLKKLELFPKEMTPIDINYLTNLHTLNLINCDTTASTTSTTSFAGSITSKAGNRIKKLKLYNCHFDYSKYDLEILSINMCSFFPFPLTLKNLTFKTCSVNFNFIKHLNLTTLNVEIESNIIFPPRLEILICSIHTNNQNNNMIFPISLKKLWILNSQDKTPLNLSYLTNLYNLKLRSINIVELPPNLTKLYYRNINHTYINSIKHLTKLTKLKLLSVSKISEFPLSLKYLSINDSVYKKLDGIENLTSLKMINCCLKDLPLNLLNLQIYSCPNIKPEDVCKLSNLLHLKCSNLYISKFPKSLESLELYIANITSINNNDSDNDISNKLNYKISLLGKLKNLTRLKLVNVPIVNNLPPNLNYLFIQNKNNKEITLNLSNLYNLQVAYLSGLKILSLPKSLQKIVLNSCNIKNNCLSNLHNLSHLSVYRTHCGFLPRDKYIKIKSYT